MSVLFLADFIHCGKRLATLRCTLAVRCRNLAGNEDIIREHVSKGGFLAYGTMEIKNTINARLRYYVRELNKFFQQLSNYESPEGSVTVNFAGA